MSQPFPTPFGRYELLERVAVGGMAEVFRARVVGREGFSKEVCIKRILPAYCQEEDFVRMFKDEARLAARLQHPNVVQIFDFDQVDGAYYIAMEFIHGRDLRAVIRDSGVGGEGLGPCRAAFMAAEVCKGLFHAHQKDGMGLVHRDVSPHNVLVGMDGQVKVMDFGIAKAADRVSKTSTGIIKGKLAYMAPEQAAGGVVDHRADQFATGLVLYEALTGQRAYDGSEPVVLHKALTGQVDAPSLIKPETPPELDDIVLRATARDPGQRYPDMKAMERALSGFLLRRAPGDDEMDLGAFMQRLYGVGARVRTQLLETVPSSVFTSVPPALAVNTQATTEVLDGAVPLAPLAPLQPAAADADTKTAYVPQPPPPRAMPPQDTATATVRDPVPWSWGRVVAALGVAGLGGGLWSISSLERAGPMPAAAVPSPSGPAATPASSPSTLPAMPLDTADLGVVAASTSRSSAVGTSSRSPGRSPAGASTAGPVSAPRMPIAKGTVRVVNRGGWAEVWVRGRQVLRETPGQFDLEPGRHVITFHNPPLGPDRQLTVDVRSRETVTVEQPLRKGP